MNRVLYILIAAITSILPLSTFAQGDGYETLYAYNELSKIAQEYEDKESFNSIMMTQSMMSLMAKSANTSSQKELLKSIDFLQILVSEKPTKELLREVEQITRDSKNLSRVISTTTNDAKSKIFFSEQVRQRPSEFLMLVYEDDKFVVIYIVGRFEIGQISSLSSLGVK